LTAQEISYHPKQSEEQKPQPLHNASNNINEIITQYHNPKSS